MLPTHNGVGGSPESSFEGHRLGAEGVERGGEGHAEDLSRESLNSCFLQTVISRKCLPSIPVSKNMNFLN